MKRAFLLSISLILSTLTLMAQQPVRRVDATPAPKGLDGRNIALWQSHGRYFNADDDTWRWQRAHLMQTIEDLYSPSYVLPLLVPMLENAGAYVMLPRERDMNHSEVIADADGSTPGASYTETNGAERWAVDANAKGFALPSGPLVGDENPFTSGKVRRVKSTKSSAEASTASWSAEIPADGTYCVYVSYATVPESSHAVRYTVNSLLGPREFIVDQSMGGGTWMLLGEFPFAKGRMDEPIVTVSNLTDAANAGRVVTADAVRIGGGMGNVARGRKGTQGSVSGMPRWMEGSRYWLQWAGAPASVYASSDNGKDYTDDFRSRPNWVNWLAGGSARIPNAKGLHIPVDVALGLHTDAGTTPDSTIYGTLGIYSTDGGSRLGDGRRRTTNRDLTDGIVDQITNDIRALHEPLWTRRKTRDRKYAEARIPQVPSTLIELLSHQNFADMRHGLNPQFRFDAARAIYKGILKYLARGGQYVVQPLPVRAFAILSGSTPGNYTLTWKPTSDPLEPTATPTAYDVEMATGYGIFLPYTSTTSTSLTFKAEEGTVYSFRIIARNDGGRAFPSETLSLCHFQGWKPEVLIVNGFTRVSAPEWFDTGDEAGFLNRIDGGVPYMSNIAYSGEQYDFVREHPWVDDIVEPGFGASRSDYDGKPVAGNTFDYPRVHGNAMAQARYPFVSASLEGYLAHYSDYKQTIIDLILGKQREIQPGNRFENRLFKAFPAELQTALRHHCRRGGSLMVSGAYIGSDLMLNEFSDAETRRRDEAFAREVLGISHEDRFAAVSGAVEVEPFWANCHNGLMTRFAAKANEKIYVTESPDAIVGAVRGESATIMRYGENGKSAAVAGRPGGRHAVVAMGFPFETIISPSDRTEVMSEILAFLLTEKIPVERNDQLLVSPAIESIIPIPDKIFPPESLIMYD